VKYIVGLISFLAFIGLSFAAPICASIHVDLRALPELHIVGYKSKTRMDKSVGPGYERKQFEKMIENHDYSRDDIGFIYTPNPMEQQIADRFFELSSGIRETHRSYGTRLSDAEKNLVQASDAVSIPTSLIYNLVGFVGVSKEGRKVGFLRVYNGTNHYTPSELILNQKEIRTDFFMNYRRQNFRILELGKYFLEADLSSTDRAAARSELFKWLVENYLNDSSEVLEKTLFVIDVSSLVHARAYKKMFGAEIVDASNFNPPLASVDFIMTVKASTLKQRLLELISEAAP
jgi:hypothetical protein